MDGPGWTIEPGQTMWTERGSRGLQLSGSRIRDARVLLEEAGLEGTEHPTLRKLKATLESVVRNIWLYGVAKR